MLKVMLKSEGVKLPVSSRAAPHWGRRNPSEHLEMLQVCTDHSPPLAFPSGLQFYPPSQVRFDSIFTANFIWGESTRSALPVLLLYLILAPSSPVSHPPKTFP